jgi:hypothetical protein
MTAVRGLSLSLSLAILPAAACQPPPEDPNWMVGAWTFSEESVIDANCGVPVQFGLEGTPVQITETPAGVEVELGCRCRLPLTAGGVLDGTERSCKFVAPPQKSQTGSVGMVIETSATVDSWTIDGERRRAGGGLTQPGDQPDTLHSRTTGTAVAINLDGDVIPPCSFTMTGRLRRSAAPHRGCGDDRTAVGVIPAASDLCPVGAGRDGLYFRMVEDKSTGCTASSSTAEGGQFPYAPPDAVKPPPRCKPRTVATTASLPFCRVDGALFTPPPALAGGALGAEYAVLKLGEVCPPGSQGIFKSINNEDVAASDTKNGSVGETGPNYATRGEVGTATVLHFCLFTPPQTKDTPLTPRAGAGGAVDAFPDLGFPYAVFHDYDGLQPAWVLGKRWLLSDNESSDPPGNNLYTGPDGQTEGTAIELLRRMVEDANTDTTFDMARVR